MKPYTVYTRYSVSDTLQSGPHFPTFRYATCFVFRKLYYVMKFHFTKVTIFYFKTFQSAREWCTLATTFICLHFISLHLCFHSVYCLHILYVFIVSCFIVLSLLAPFTRVQLYFVLSMEVTNFSWRSFLLSLTCQKETEREWLFP